MKKFYFLSLALLILISANAQKNFAFPSDNPFWTENHGWLSPVGAYYYYYNCTKPVYYKSDTIINSLTYNRLYSYGLCTVENTTPPPSYFNSYLDSEMLFAIIRQDTINKKVYLWDQNKDTLLYDFQNLNVGQYYPQTYNNNPPNIDDTVVVVSMDSILLNYLYYTKWNLGIRRFGTIVDSSFVSIIEGVGSTFGILSTLYPPFENNDQLLCFSINNIVIYPDSTYDCDKALNVVEQINEQNILIYPNPASDRLIIDTRQNNIDLNLTLYNINGQEIMQKQIKNIVTDLDISSLKKGIYFVRLINDRTVEVRKIIKE